MREFGYHRAESASHAVELADDHGDDALFLAGGQSLNNVLKARLAGEDNQVIDLGDLDDLSYVEGEEDVVRIGAMTTHADLANSDLLAESIPAFPEMVAQVGDVQIRNMGTIGGDMAQADPQADYPVLLTALGGDVTIRTTDGTRTESLSDFFLSYFETALGPAELLVTVTVTVPGDDAAAGFDKFAERKGDFPIVNAAAVLEAEDGVIADARIRVGCVSGTPTTPTGAEEYAEGKAVVDLDPADIGARASADITPDPDEETDVKFKTDLVEAMVKNAVDDARNRIME